MAQAQRLERELLVQSYSQPTSGAATPILSDDAVHSPPRASRRTRQQQQSSLNENDQQTVGASTNVTLALRRTHDLIAAELARSEFAHQTLTESSAALKQLNESYSSLDNMLANSRDLLGTLLRSQKSDTWYLQTAFYMLLVTGAWLVFRRFLYGPAWWLVWLPIRLVFGTGFQVGSAVMRVGSSPGESGNLQMGEESGKIPVEGLPNEDLPTIQVRQEAKTAAPGNDPDSMVEQVGKIVDAVNEVDGLGGLPEEPGVEDIKEDDETERPRNTKKRMWEERLVVEEDTRPRDEL